MAADWTAREMELVRSLSIAGLPQLPPAPSNRVADDPRAAELGRALFFDPRFSGNGQISCASCHSPETGFQDGRPLAIGLRPTTRRTMPLAGAAYSPFHFWDGRADSLWSQALQPFEAAEEHGGNRTAFVHLIAKHYRAQYEAVFGTMPDVSHLPPHAGPVPDASARLAWSNMAAENRAAVTTVFVNMGKAIAAFERKIQPAETRFDAWVADADFPSPGLLNPTEIAGLRLFVGKAGCIDCHNGPLLTNQSFHNTGVPLAGSADIGRAKGVRMLVLSPFNCRGKYSDAG
ncbi:MAG: cytochrome-c peroxidase, partial [Silicimonas sp.]|nr:cytochrome-c peroxidase [Silicimonas sp.]